jgi:multiple antibiotic resistance protein
MKLGITITIVAALWPATAGAADDFYRLDGSEILTLFLVMLGPLKILGPFARLTRGAPLGQVRRLAWQAVAIASVALLVGGFLGRGLLVNWQIPTPVLELTAGVVFFLVALSAILAQYEDPAPTSPPAEALPSPISVAFPLVVTPYGMAAVITLLALSHGIDRTGLVLGLLLVVMLANLAAMFWVRHLMTPGVVTVLQVLGAVLGILQVALAVRILLGALAKQGLLGSA